MLSRSRTRSAVVAALCGTAALALLIHVVTVSSGPSLLEEEEEMMDDAPVQEAAPVETTEEFYTALHPVYGRCKNQIKLHQFVGTIQRTCGNIHELNEAMWAASEKFGCCWETVMDGYQQLYPHAAHAWRTWQGTLSGKAGVTFQDKSCGAPMGEKGYGDLKNKVDGLEETVNDQNSEIQYLEAMLFYG
ncbi:hypothetical protein T484DRAFT_1840483, partial [Baffinella frigidus]